MKLIVAGSRDFTDYRLAAQYLDAIHAKHTICSRKYIKFIDDILN